jgi:hypothetical protein
MVGLACTFGGEYERQEESAGYGESMERSTMFGRFGHQGVGL